MHRDLKLRILFNSSTARAMVQRVKSGRVGPVQTKVLQLLDEGQRLGQVYGGGHRGREFHNIEDLGTWIHNESQIVECSGRCLLRTGVRRRGRTTSEACGDPRGLCGWMWSVRGPRRQLRQLGARLRGPQCARHWETFHEGPAQRARHVHRGRELCKDMGHEGVRPGEDPHRSTAGAHGRSTRKLIGYW